MSLITIIHMTITGINLLWLYIMVIILFLYRTKLYSRWFLPRFADSFTPSVSLFIPCKGVSTYFPNNIATFLELDYPSYTLYFIVESEDDPAYPVLKKMISSYPRAELVVAGLSKHCGQKNYNILKGIEHSGEKDDIYVFMDSDIAPTTKWLEELIHPLSNKKVTVATGFRWLLLHKKSAGEYLHAFMNAFLLLVINFFPVDAVWGGSMAIRRKDFEDLNVKEFWGKTVVDDITLEKLILKNRKKTVHVPTCIAETDEVIPTVPRAVSWFKRQTMYSKMYIPHLWLTGVLLMLYPAIHVAALPLLVIFSIVAPSPELSFLTGYTGIYVLLLLLWAALIKKPGKDNHNRFIWFVRAPFNLILGSYASLLTLWEKKIDWSGITYHMNRRGEVKKIERTVSYEPPGEEELPSLPTNP